MLFEAFLGGNSKFNSLNEVITFIHNVVSEKNERKLLDEYILDRNISRAECFYKLLNDADLMIWVPTEKEMVLLWERLEGLNQEDINRLYYKNNLYMFADLPVISDLIIKILKELKMPFMTPNDVPEEIQDDLNVLTQMMKEYVYYGHQIIDRMDRYSNMYREACIVTDTDS